MILPSGFGEIWEDDEQVVEHLAEVEAELEDWENGNDTHAPNDAMLEDWENARDREERMDREDFIARVEQQARELEARAGQAALAATAAAPSRPWSPEPQRSFLPEGTTATRSGEGEGG